MLRQRASIFGIALLLFLLIVLYPLIAAYGVREELSIAESVLAFGKDKDDSNYLVTRHIGNKRVQFVFNPMTVFFLYREDGEETKIGYYWRNLSLLEKKLDIPYVGSNFATIQTEASLEEMPDRRDALELLNQLRVFPLSYFDRVSFVMEVMMDKMQGKGI